ncbi:MAG: hypothetical protein PHU85_04730, partial [Phycisphaerae bacterium]|nr:hypothetical protein [Phycisphaerae bacterium]
MTRTIAATFGFFIAAGLWIGLSLAVDSVNVEQDSTEEFQDGTFDDVVLNNLGELKLARKMDSLLKGDKDVAFVNAIVADDKGNVYAATAPSGKLFRITPAGECELWYTAKEKTLQSLATGPKGELYLGTGGGDGKIYRVTGKNAADLVLEREGLAYVWSMVVLPDGKIVAGTGPNAELLLVAPDGKAAAGDVLYKPEKEKQKNILSVAADSGGKTIYFGTDTDGLVLKYDLAARKPFLLYDAEESEIACLAVAPDGTVYAGTSDPRAGADGEHAVDEPDGEPDGPAVHGATSGRSTGDDADDDAETPAAKPKASPAPQKPATVEPIIVPPKSDLKLSAWPTGVRPLADVAAADEPLAAPTTRPGDKGRKPVVAGAKPVGKTPTSRPAAEDKDMTIESVSKIVRGGPHGGGRVSHDGGESGGGNAVYRIDARGFV